MLIFCLFVFVITITNNNIQVNNILVISTLLHIITYYYTVSVLKTVFSLCLYVISLYVYVKNERNNIASLKYCSLIVLHNKYHTLDVTEHPFRDSETRRSKRSPYRCEVPPTFA